MPDMVINSDGVEKLLKELQPNKAVGPDGVSGRILQMAAQELAPGLTLVFNKSLSTGNLPQDWLTANITPIYKKRSKAFQTLVRPHLEYCSTVWNPHTKELIDKIETIQRRGARFVFSDYRRTSSVTTMLEKLDWKPLHLRRKVACVSMFHKIVNTQVAIPAHEFVQPVQTRKSSRPGHTQSYSRLTDQYMNSYFSLTTKSWNNLPQQIVDIKLTTQFKTAVAEFIYSQEESTQRD
ncbi:uncharacterized protein [Amphiura filiformis]|uniref:uncharacterized protein n=1 Tax=Amphiura filiformis TaxID=82378 RepID=UPI003B211524